MHTRIWASAAAAAVIAVAGCGQTDDGSNEPAPEAPTADVGQDPTGADETGSSTGADSGTDSGDDDPGSISLDEAATIVTDEYGGEVIGVEDDDFRGTPAWEVEVKDSDEGRIEVKVDRKTGEILDMEHD